jgi:hypothetical protein
MPKKRCDGSYGELSDNVDRRFISKTHPYKPSSHSGEGYKLT